MIGRKKKSIHLHLLQGNKAHLTKKEIAERIEAYTKPAPKRNKVKPPYWLDEVAKKEFQHIVKECEKQEIITNLDVQALAAYCDAYSDYIKCTGIIQEEGFMVKYTNKASETNYIPHPLLTKKKQLHDQMKTLALEFGLTPYSRMRLAHPQKERTAMTEEERLFGHLL